MQGKVVGHCLVIMDSFALPVQGTETRVNAANEANEYMVQYIQESEKVCESLRAQRDVHRLIFNTSAGGAVRECDRLVPFASWVWLLAVRHRCEHANEQPEIHRSVRGRCRAIQYTLLPLVPVLMVCCLDRSQPHDLCRACGHRRLSHLSSGLYTTQCINIRISEYPPQQDRGFRRSCKPILLIGGADLQVKLRHRASWLAMEQVLGQYT